MIGQGAVAQFRSVILNLKPIASGTLAYFVEKLQGIARITGLNYRARALKAPVFAGLLTAAFVSKEERIE